VFGNVPRKRLTSRRDPAGGREVPQQFGISRGGGTLVFRLGYFYAGQPPQKPTHPGEYTWYTSRHRPTLALVTPDDESAASASVRECPPDVIGLGHNF
jgi:hypothetical protein